MANYQKLCDDVIEAHEELTELTEQIALIDKTNTAALELVKEYYKAISNLATNLKTRIASKSAAARSAKAKAAASTIDSLFIFSSPLIRLDGGCGTNSAAAVAAMRKGPISPWRSCQPLCSACRRACAWCCPFHR